MREKVSIITVCYNAEQDLKKTIESVRNQTYKNIDY
ncbi:MAG: glycosyltransferase, partial [Bacteroidales bacterium]|nr:glycosyltransferase [Bacteroidales bacterium]